MVEFCGYLCYSGLRLLSLPPLIQELRKYRELTFYNKMCAYAS